MPHKSRLTNKPLEQETNTGVTQQLSHSTKVYFRPMRHIGRSDFCICIFSRWSLLLSCLLLLSFWSSLAPAAVDQYIKEIGWHGLSGYHSELTTRLAVILLTSIFQRKHILLYFQFELKTYRTLNRSKCFKYVLNWKYDYNTHYFHTCVN